SEQHEIARIVAAPDRDFAQRVGHMAVDHAADAGGASDAHPERLRELRADRGGRPLEIELHASAEEIVRVKNAEDQVRIGDGGELAAAAVAAGPGVAPALSGPTRRRPPCTRAMEPPPAPMARISMTGVLR